MDAATIEVDPRDIDPKHELQSDIDGVRAERDDLDQQIAADRERLTTIRAALDTMVGATWRDIFGQQQAMRDKENITAALTLGWIGGYQLIAAAAFIIFAAAAVFVFQVAGSIVAILAYIVLALIGYFVARDQCLALIKKTRQSYLGNDGKDVRFVAFTKFEPGLAHPLLGYDGPTDGSIDDRAWKIPGVREKDALSETFVEVIDERHTNVLLTRFPDKKPVLVHADLENPFIRAYGVFFQRALERHMSSVQTQADEFREIVLHFGQRKSIDDRLHKLEAEMAEFDGTAAIVKQIDLPISLRNALLRRVMLFRLGDPSVRRGMMLITGDRGDTMDVMQNLARASAATLLHLSYSQIKIGYVGQGAATVGRIFSTAKRARSIIFIDEAERFFAVGGSPAYEAMRREVVQAIITEWEALEDRSDVWVVAAARDREGLDDAIVARFGALVDLTPNAVQEAPKEEVEAQHTVEIDVSDADKSRWLEAEELPEPVVQRSRLLSAMFAHVETMESQGIAVPRAILIAGPSQGAKQTFIESVREQTALPIFGAVVDDLDDALVKARGAGRALVVVDVPEYAEPGAVAHLAVTLDDLVEKKAPIFILATTAREDAIDPELRERFTELVDLTELDGSQRRARLMDLLATKPIGFHLLASMDELEARTEGMTEEQLRQFVDEAGRKAALRAIDNGTPDQILIVLDDFERRIAPIEEVEAEDGATKADEAAL